MNTYTAIVYSAPGCQKCRATERLLARAGVTVITEQIHDTPEALDKMHAEGWVALPLVKIEAPDGEVMWWNDLNSKNIDALKWLVNNE